MSERLLRIKKLILDLDDTTAEDFLPELNHLDKELTILEGKIQDIETEVSHEHQRQFIEAERALKEALGC